MYIEALKKMNGCIMRRSRTVNFLDYVKKSSFYFLSLQGRAGFSTLPAFHLCLWYSKAQSWVVSHRGSGELACGSIRAHLRHLFPVISILGWLWNTKVSIHKLNRLSSYVKTFQCTTGILARTIYAFLGLQQSMLLFSFESYY